MRAYRPCALVRWWQRLTAPVPQDTRAVMFGEYRGKVVMLYPVMSSVRPWLVQRWIMDPNAVRRIDSMLDEDAQHPPADGGCGGLPPLPPEPANVPQEPEVNPAEIGGL